MLLNPVQVCWVWCPLSSPHSPPSGSACISGWTSSASTWRPPSLCSASASTTPSSSWRPGDSPASTIPCRSGWRRHIVRLLSQAGGQQSDAKNKEYPKRTKSFCRRCLFIYNTLKAGMIWGLTISPSLAGKVPRSYKLVKNPEKSAEICQRKCAKSWANE